MENNPAPKMSFADELRMIQIQKNGSKKKQAKPDPVTTSFFVEDLFGGFSVADDSCVQNKYAELFILNGDEYIPWRGERPKPKAHAEEIISQNTLPVTVVSDQFTDMRLASLFATLFVSVLRYWYEAEKFLVFDGHRWTSDTPGGAFVYIRKMVEHLYQRAMDCEYAQRSDILKAILKLEEHPRQVTVLNAARVRPELIVSAADLDQHDMLLTVANGTIELNTGTLRPSSSDDLLTRMTPINYDPIAKCPQFLAFLNKIFGGNENVIRYVQRFAGYCLTGKISEQVLMFFYGLGGNGKSVLANILRALVGDYGNTAGSDLLMPRDKRCGSSDLASLRGARLVTVSEFNDNSKLDEAMVKTVTGGDPVTCRFLFRDFFSYVPTWKPLLIGNHHPKISGSDEGIWRRIHLLNFCVTIPKEERDPYLQDKLLKELPGILAWAVQGCLEWQSKGLSAPPEVMAAVADYRKSEDTFSQWIDECCTRGANQSASAASLLVSYIEYTKETKTTSKKLGQMLTSAGLVPKKIHGLSWWEGVSVPQPQNHRSWNEKDDDTRPF